MKSLFLAIILIIIVSSGFYILNRSKNPPVLPTPTPVQIIVGGDKDEYGCIGSAGYSWCGAKNKCIRIWEEDCLSKEKITSALSVKEKRPLNTIFITITKENTKYARGSVSSSPQGGEGGMFLAAKVEDDWQIVFSGNGSVNCPDIKKNYNFPPDFLQGFCD